MYTKDEFNFKLQKMIQIGAKIESTLKYSFNELHFLQHNFCSLCLSPVLNDNSKLVWEGDEVMLDGTTICKSNRKNDVSLKKCREKCRRQTKTIQTEEFSSKLTAYPAQNILLIFGYCIAHLIILVNCTFRNVWNETMQKSESD